MLVFLLTGGQRGTQAVKAVESGGSDEANTGVIRTEEDDICLLSPGLEELQAEVSSSLACCGVVGKADAAEALGFKVNEEVNTGVVPPQTEGGIVDWRGEQTGHLQLAQEALRPEEPTAVNNCWQ